MSTFRFVVLTSALLAICQANPSALTKNDANNIVQCPNPSVSTTFLANDPVYEPAGGFLQIKKKVYRFPKEGVNAVPITCIYILDRSADGTGAYPQLVSGGYNHYYIEILFTSQRGKAINSNVELYG